MTSENHTPTSIVPASTEVISTLFVEMVKDMPTKLREKGLEVSDTITDEEVLTLVDRLLITEKHLTVGVRFRLGDLYNQLTKRRNVRKKALDAVCVKYGTKYYQLFRTYGWVAAKWPHDTRNNEKPWSYWVKYKRGGLLEPKKEKPPVSLTFTEEERLPDGTIVLHGEAPNGRRYTMRPPVKSPYTAMQTTEERAEYRDEPAET